MNGIQHPTAFPIFRCRPERVRGSPILRLSFPFADDIPIARFQLKLNPYFFPIENPFPAPNSGCQ